MKTNGRQWTVVLCVVSTITLFFNVYVTTKSTESAIIVGEHLLPKQKKTLILGYTTVWFDGMHTVFVRTQVLTVTSGKPEKHVEINTKLKMKS
jgi:hypothetical protein